MAKKKNEEESSQALLDEETDEQADESALEEVERILDNNLRAAKILSQQSVRISIHVTRPPKSRKLKSSGNRDVVELEHRLAEVAGVRDPNRLSHVRNLWDEREPAFRKAGSIVSQAKSAVASVSVKSGRAGEWIVEPGDREKQIRMLSDAQVSVEDVEAVDRFFMQYEPLEDLQRVSPQHWLRRVLPMYHARLRQECDRLNESGEYEALLEKNRQKLKEQFNRSDYDSEFRMELSWSYAPVAFDHEKSDFEIEENRRIIADLSASVEEAIQLCMEETKKALSTLAETMRAVNTGEQKTFKSSVVSKVGDCLDKIKYLMRTLVGNDPRLLQVVASVESIADNLMDPSALRSSAANGPTLARRRQQARESLASVADSLVKDIEKHMVPLGVRAVTRSKKPSGL